MKDKIRTIGITPSQADKQRWLNAFATAAFYTFMDQIGDNLKKAGKDKTGESLKKAIQTYRNLVKHLNSTNITFMMSVPQYREASTAENPELSMNNQTENK